MVVFFTCGLRIGCWFHAPGVGFLISIHVIGGARLPIPLWWPSSARDKAYTGAACPPLLLPIACMHLGPTRYHEGQDDAVITMAAADGIAPSYTSGHGMPKVRVGYQGDTVVAGKNVGQPALGALSCTGARTRKELALKRTIAT